MCDADYHPEKLRSGPLQPLPGLISRCTDRLGLIGALTLPSEGSLFPNKIGLMISQYEGAMSHNGRKWLISLQKVLPGISFVVRC